MAFTKISLIYLLSLLLVHLFNDIFIVFFVIKFLKKTERNTNICKNYIHDHQPLLYIITVYKSKHEVHKAVVLPIVTSRWGSNWPFALQSGQWCQRCHLTAGWGAGSQSLSSVSARPLLDGGWCSAAPTGTHERLTRPSRLEGQKRKRVILGINCGHFIHFILFNKS